MALQTAFCARYAGPLKSTGNTSLLLDASGEKAAAIVQCTKAGNIHKLHVYLGTVTTGQTLKISLQDLDGNGDPDGTVDQSGTVAVADSDDNTWKSVTLGADRTVAVGDFIAIVVEFNATVGNLNVLCNDTSVAGNSYPDLYTGTWAKQNRGPMVVVEMDDTSIMYLNGVNPLLMSSVTYGTTGSPDEIALKFQVPFACKCGGGEYWGRQSDNCQLILYDSNGTSILGTSTHDADQTSFASDNTYAGHFTPATLTINTNYYLALKPTTTAGVRLYYGDVGTASHLGTLPGGANCHWAQQVDAGGWTPTTTRRPLIWPILTDFSDNVGGGGGSGYIWELAGTV